MKKSVEVVEKFYKGLTKKERNFLSVLNSPLKIQDFLDGLPYSAEDRYRCPLSVLREREAHCFDGALFAAAGLRLLGFMPLIVYLIAENDDDHLLAPFKCKDHWGAISKSNYAGLRFREPIHRTLRELVMTYFESCYNVKGEKSLRSYTLPLNLARFDRYDWMQSDLNLEWISDALDGLRTVPLLTRRMIRNLSPVDQRSYRAGLLGARKAGLYDPD
jgi:hypothetical protein